MLAVEIKKRKKVLSWPSLMKRLSPLSDFSGASETELKTSLFDQPLSVICGDDDTLPRPIQVGTHLLVNPLQFSIRCKKCLGNLNVILMLNLLGPIFSLFPLLEIVVSPISVVRRISGCLRSRN